MRIHIEHSERPGGCRQCKAEQLLTEGNAVEAEKLFAEMEREAIPYYPSGYAQSPGKRNTH